jgi:leucyl-tRNA---protein transferase
MRELARLVEEPRACSYLPEEVASLEYRIVQDLRPIEYERLLARGYRRFGAQLFRPECLVCRQCVSVRVLVERFDWTAGFRRVLRRNSGISVELSRPSTSDEHIDLYHRYHDMMARTRGWRRERISRAEYVESFVAAGGDFAWQWSYRDRGELVGLAFMDETPNAISLVYSFHAPEWRPAGPGTFSFLVQLGYAQQAGKRFAYPGYWIAANRSMAYKARFQPMERLARHPRAGEEPVWLPFDEADEPPIEREAAAFG